MKTKGLKSKEEVRITMLSESDTVQPADTQKNKKMVMDFFNTAFVDKKIQEAFDTYVGDTYIQHNPNLPNGKEPVIGFLSKIFLDDNPQISVSVKRVIAEGDIVVVHHHSKNTPRDPGLAIVEIYRVENGKIVEHWDVLQNVPETSANDNTMF